MTIVRGWPSLLFSLTACVLAACGPRAEEPAHAEARPSIVLVTLDTTRADAMGQDTPAFRELASRGLECRQAYATAPQTLPSHASMMTGLYPAAHRIHENARYLSDDQKLLAATLHENGYRTAAFVSAYPLARQFGLARGFDHYDDSFPAGSTERSARETTDRALAWWHQQSEPTFLWVHYFEPHYPYEPPGSFADRYRDNPYRGEVAAMDHELGRLLKSVETQRKSPVAIIVAGDHGEGLGEHGESQHGNLLYQGVMHVPLVLAGPGVNPGISNIPVSTRRVFHTILDFAGLVDPRSLRSQNETPEVVLGEAMQPFLQFGWQPQIMAVEDRLKVIQAGKIETYDVIADPGETRDLAGANAPISRRVRQSLRDYPVPTVQEAAPASLSEEDRRQLASLGYVSSDAAPVIRPDAPRPRDMAHLFATLDRASGLFIAEEYAASIPLFEQILREDPHNLTTILRLAAAHSALGRKESALAAFRRAQALAPESLDVSHYLALHYLRTGEWERAEPLLEHVLAATPNRLPAIEAMAVIRERQGRPADALTLRLRALAMKKPEPPELLKTAELAMMSANTPVALEMLERARTIQGEAFRNDLELGVVYLDAGRLTDARDALDRVSSSNPGYPMALFKRAQVSALLHEPDLAARVAAARRFADATTGPLIARERLFNNL